MLHKYWARPRAGGLALVNSKAFPSLWGIYIGSLLLFPAKGRVSRLS